MYFAFDLLELDGEDIARLPLRERKRASRRCSRTRPPGSPSAITKAATARSFRRAACKHGLEGIVSKRLDRPYLPGDRGAWVKTKCLNRAEFVVVGWSDPEGSRPYVGALLLGYFEPDGRLVYAGRVGTGMSQKTLATLHKRLQPLAIKKDASRRSSASRQPFGRPLELARAHWVRPELVAEITYLSWPDDGLLRHTVFVGLREDKPAGEVRREKPGS